MPPVETSDASRHPGTAHPGLVAFGVALVFLVAACSCLADFGPTWDMVMGEYPYGERLLEYVRTGDERFLELKATEPAPLVREPHPDFEVGRFEWFQIFPVGALLSALSCRLFWTELGWVPAMAAHHAVVPFLAAAIVFAITAFCARRVGALAGIVAGGALAANPVFFGHACHNLKDAPECVFYTGAVLAGFLALENGRTRWWLTAGALTGLALAQKANALFLPVQLVLFLVAGCALRSAGQRERPRLSLRGFAWMTLAFLLTYYAVSPAYWASPIDGPRRVIGHMLSGGSAPGSVINHQALRDTLYTTPPITLVLAFLGLFHRGVRPRVRLLLLVGAGLPVARNLIPGMRHYDLTRHFLEYLPMLCALAGSGAALVFASTMKRLVNVPGSVVAAAVGAVALVPCLLPTIDTHPNQIAYFNALVGGLGGAQRAGIPDATTGATATGRACAGSTSTPNPEPRCWSPSPRSWPVRPLRSACARTSSSSRGTPGDRRRST